LVRKLPPPPDGFSGLVGDFSFYSRLDRQRVPVGGSVAWTLEVAGNGALAGWKPPTFDADAQLPISLYDNDQTVEARVHDGVFSTVGRYERVIVPLKAGQLTLPKLDVVVFSPSKNAYITKTVPMPAVVVTPGREQGADIESFAGELPEGLAEGDEVDFRGNYSWGWGSTPALYRVVPSLAVVTALPAGGVAVQALFLGVAGWLKRRREATIEAPKASARLLHLPADPEQRLVAFDAALRQALADHAGIDVAELDRAAEIDALPDGLRERVAQLGRELDRARFAGDASVEEDLVRDAVLELERLT
jgi:hypothetical protein